MDIAVIDSKIHGKRIQGIKVNGYSVDWDNLMRWCSATYGPLGDVFDTTTVYRWYANNSTIWLRDDKDLTMFILKWS